MNAVPPLIDVRAGSYRFHGGLQLDGHKAISAGAGIIDLPLQPCYRVPLNQQRSAAAEVVVAVGESVAKGQVIARGAQTQRAILHAPTSGSISAIAPRAVAHPSGLPDICIDIEADQEDRWCTLSGCGDAFDAHPPDVLLDKLEDSGIAGLGGAVFPTVQKLHAGIQRKVHTLIINGAECEPWISCDQALMQTHAETIVQGAKIAQYLTGASRCIIGIEDNKPVAIHALETAARISGTPLSVISIPTLYPTGGERQLIKVLTNQEVPMDGYPADLGILVLNVGTVQAIQDAIVDGKPLIDRIVTVTGDGVLQPCNIRARIGTPMHALIAAAGGYHDKVAQLTMGGPMMGFSLASDDLPIVKASNCLLAQTSRATAKKPTALPCIRCSACADVCPAELLPQQLYWYSQSKNLDALTSHSLASCIECGCCDYVCPSHIPLVHYFRFAKTEVRSAHTEKQKATLAKQRHDAREARLERLKREKAEKMAARKAELAAKKQQQTGAEDKKAAIAAALARGKKRKQALRNDSDAPPTSAKPPMAPCANSASTATDKTQH